MSKIDFFWDRTPGWLLNAGWIGQGLALAASKVMHFIKEDGYALALFVGTWISIWGLWRKNRLQIRREQILLMREEEAFSQDKLHREEIQQIKIDREKRLGKPE